MIATKIFKRIVITLHQLSMMLRGEKERGRRFVCFSPESFLRIKDGCIYSYPMKGTIDTSLPNTEQYTRLKATSAVSTPASWAYTAMAISTQRSGAEGLSAHKNYSNFKNTFIPQLFLHISHIA